MTLDEREAVYKAEYEAAGQAMMSALMAYVAAIQKHHGFVEWRSGFKSGWKASREYHEEQIKKSFESELKASAGVAGPSGVGMLAGVEFMEPYPLPSALPPSPPPLTPTANELVHQFVAENPGKRGVEIADNFSKTVWRLPERTVRTALHRLKKAEKILVLEGRWYTPENIPADLPGAPQPTMPWEKEF